jgi:hypothetical protein
VTMGRMAATNIKSNRRLVKFRFDEAPPSAAKWTMTANPTSKAANNRIRLIRQRPVNCRMESQNMVPIYRSTT